MYGLQGPTKENIFTFRSKIYSRPAQIKQTLYTQPGVTYALVTTQNSYTSTNIEQEPRINQSHQQTSDMIEFKYTYMMKSLFEQMEIAMNLLRTELNRL
jgi:hypothetical protein